MRRNVLIRIGLTLGIAALGSTSASACDWDDCGNGCGSYGYYAAPVHYARPAYAYYAPPVYYAAPAYYAAPRLHVLWASFRGCHYGGHWAANFDRRKGFVAAGRPAAGQGFYTHAAKNGPGWNKTPAANLGIQVRPTSVTNHPQAMSNDPTAKRRAADAVSLSIQGIRAHWYSQPVLRCDAQIRR